jgi:hypothetical protein
MERKCCPALLLDHMRRVIRGLFRNVFSLRNMGGTESELNCNLLTK